MMEKKKTPLVSGLIGSKSNAIHGQLEVTLINYNTVQIAFWRKMYCGLPDICFTIADTDLQDILKILSEASDKIEAHWLSKMSTTAAYEEEETAAHT